MRKPIIHRQLIVTLPNGETIQARRGVQISEVCGLEMSSFGLPARFTPLAPAPGTLATVTVRAQLPASVRAGTILRYTITLTNPTKQAIKLRPCRGTARGSTRRASSSVVR